MVAVSAVQHRCLKIAQVIVAHGVPGLPLRLKACVLSPITVGSGVR